VLGQGCGFQAQRLSESEFLECYSMSRDKEILCIFRDLDRLEGVQPPLRGKLHPHELSRVGKEFGERFEERGSNYPEKAVDSPERFGENSLITSC